MMSSTFRHYEFGRNCRILCIDRIGLVQADMLTNDVLLFQDENYILSRAIELLRDTRDILRVRVGDMAANNDENLFVYVRKYLRIPRTSLFPSYLLLTSSTARRITSASVIPSLVACFKIHACWEAVRTICRWMPLVMFSPFKVANRANIHVYCEIVK